VALAFGVSGGSDLFGGDGVQAQKLVDRCLARARDDPSTSPGLSRAA